MSSRQTLTSSVDPRVNAVPHDFSHPALSKTSTRKTSDVLGDCFTSDEAKSGRVALLWWLCFMAFLIGIGFWLSSTLGQILSAWWLFSSLYYLVVWPMRENRSLQPLNFSATSQAALYQKQHHLRKTLLRANKLLGVREPSVLLDSRSHIRVSLQAAASSPTLCITQGAMDALQKEELDCLVLNSLIHHRYGYSRRLMILRLLEQTPRMARRGLAWPVALYGFLLRLRWQAQAESASDRLTLLLIGNSKLFERALLKEFASTDANLVSQKITSQGVESYVQQANVIGSGGEGMTIQYRIGMALRENPHFESRLRTLKAWGNSQEYAEARQALVKPKADVRRGTA